MSVMFVMLDDADAITRADSSGMLRQIADLPQQLKASIATKVDMGEARVDNVCICGLGGSAMSGDILSDQLDRSSLFPSAVVRDVQLPRWVDDKTLTLLISYSGNTKETMAMYEQARKRNSLLVAITSGGSLLQTCQECGERTVEVPSGLQPRAALGYLLGASAKVLESAGVTPVATELSGMVASLDRLVGELVPSVPTERNVAKQVARDLEGKIPAVYSSRSVRAAAKRWQTQINENSKMLCLQGELPEADHNQIVGWLDGAPDAVTPVFLRASTDSGMMADIMSTTIGMFADFGRQPLIVELEGASPLENVMRGVVIGDFVSYYLAMVQGVDPMPVPSITELKKRLG
ncbi:bifunctional phosphoglucose/phosphomannose isomerase [Methanomassiliicoccus luminyensis]|uniref:bifunctional phosphoglucose/phosphomannose isomerase n=2 Tax=Methanomassiliicoccus luminyensis TaxID=1080712 RepID=UPI0009D9DDB8|nr:bifunctional phosphoglucose/phosphomannose isomerase [Methanomassiliicoccus luminyensis]